MWWLGSSLFSTFYRRIFLVFEARQHNETRDKQKRRNTSNKAAPHHRARGAPALFRLLGPPLPASGPSSPHRSALCQCSSGHGGPAADRCEAVLGVSFPRHPSRSHPPTSVRSMRPSRPHVVPCEPGEDLGVHSGEHDYLVTEHSIPDLIQHAVPQSRLPRSALSPEPHEDPYTSTSSPELAIIKLRDFCQSHCGFKLHSPFNTGLYFIFYKLPVAVFCPRGCVAAGVSFSCGFAISLRLLANISNGLLWPTIRQLCLGHLC